MRVEIPDALAKELSDLLSKQAIRMQVLSSITDKPDEYEKMEALLIPINQRIDAIKYQITEEYIPDDYCSDDYQWYFNNYLIDKNTVDIRKA